MRGVNNRFSSSPLGGDEEVLFLFYNNKTTIKKVSLVSSLSSNVVAVVKCFIYILTHQIPDWGSVSRSASQSASQFITLALTEQSQLLLDSKTDMTPR